MFVTPAFAQTAGAGGAGAAFGSFLPLILIFAIMYFLLIRPQQKKIKQHKETLEGIRRGDKVITGGGIIATVTKIENDMEVTVEIAKDVKVRIQRSTIAGVINRTEPVGGKPANEHIKISTMAASQGLRRFSPLRSSMFSHSKPSRDRYIIKPKLASVVNT